MLVCKMRYFSKSIEGVTFPLSLRHHFKPRLENNYGALQY